MNWIFSISFMEVFEVVAFLFLVYHIFHIKRHITRIEGIEKNMKKFVKTIADHFEKDEILDEENIRLLKKLEKFLKECGGVLKK